MTFCATCMLANSSHIPIRGVGLRLCRYHELDVREDRGDLTFMAKVELWARRNWSVVALVTSFIIYMGAYVYGWSQRGFALYGG